MNRHFFEADIQMANKYIKRCLMPLIIREKEMKATMRYHFIPIRMATTYLKRKKKTTFGEDVEKLEPWYNVGEKMV